jgi:cytochrome P450
MLLHPEVQRKARAEIHAVVGTDRLPDFSEAHRLTYIQAVILELLRWHPAAPLGKFILPHFL